VWEGRHAFALAARGADSVPGDGDRGRVESNLRRTRCHRRAHWCPAARDAGARRRRAHLGPRRHGPWRRPRWGRWSGRPGSSRWRPRRGRSPRPCADPNPAASCMRPGQEGGEHAERMKVLWRRRPHPRSSTVMSAPATRSWIVLGAPVTTARSVFGRQQARGLRSGRLVRGSWPTPRPRRTSRRPHRSPGSRPRTGR